MMEFLAMGKYAAYVWPSYGLTLVIMVVLLVASLRSLKSTEATFERLKAEVGPIRDRTRDRTRGKNNNTEELDDGDEA